MKKSSYGVYALVFFGLFYFSEGKPCPERTRPHRTRCDAYYKCAEIAGDKHVWVPSRCEEGLVYEHSLAVCVLPADDWECLMGGDHETEYNPNLTKSSDTTIATRNRDADIYIVSNANGEDDDIGDKKLSNDDDKVEIIIGSDISNEDKDEDDDEEVYDGSGNGGELVELDGFMPTQKDKDKKEVLPVAKTVEHEHENTKYKKKQTKLEPKEDIEEVIQTLQTKAEMGQASSNIDPKLTAHLQRLSQLIDGLKQTYQTTDEKQENEQDTLRPDQLNAFLAHFNIKNKLDTFDPSEGHSTGATTISTTTTTTPKPNRTLHYEHELTTKLSPETKVVLSNMLPQRYHSKNHDSSGGYSNSQIVVNRPEGSVQFSLPAEHHFAEHSEYSSDHAPKISEETLKTVLELSKQMIAQQNVPKIIPNPTYFASSIMQPILLTPHVDSPFSTNFIPQTTNGLSFSGQTPFSSNGGYNQNYKYKKPGKRPEHGGSNNGYKGNDISDYGNNKPGTTIIHNNVIPVHVSTTNSGEKEVLDSYGHSLGLYPQHHEERPHTNTDYNSNSNSNSPYSNNYQTTKRPSYLSISTTSSSYSTTYRPFNYRPTASNINEYFTPSEHLGDHNVNNVFPTVDNFGSIPRPIKNKRPNQQMMYRPPSSESMNNGDAFNAMNELFPQIDNHKVHVRPNSQIFESMESDNDDVLNTYQDDNNEEETKLATYTYGNKNKPAAQQSHYSNYAESAAQTSINSVFSTNNAYMPRPQTSKPNNVIQSGNSYFSTGKNKYTPISSPISSAYGEVGGNTASLSSTLNKIEVITCAAGVRQPNTTDCTRYYVCSKKDGKVLSYSCPPYTAFNSEARICDARTYAMCSPNALQPNYSVSENKRLQMEAIKTLQEAKRRQMLQQQKQQQAIKAQNIANLLQQYNSPTSSSFTSISSPGQDSSEQSMLNSYMQQAASMGQNYGTTPRPQITTTTVTKKRKYYCKEGDKIADQTSINNYFVCYKNAQGQMKGHKMTCSKGLLFCPSTTMCTLPSKCS